jgi:hypothetical protein
MIIYHSECYVKYLKINAISFVFISFSICTKRKKKKKWNYQDNKYIIYVKSIIVDP